MTSEAKKIKVQKWPRKLGIFLTALFLIPALLFTLGWFNRDFLIDGLQEWYRNNNNGNLEIGEVNASFLEGFPNVGFTIKNIHQTSFDSILDKRSSIFIKHARVSVGASDLLLGQLEFKNIELDHATIRSQVISKKSLEEYILNKKTRHEEPGQGLNFPRWFDASRTNFRLSDIKLSLKDTMLNKQFELVIKEATGKIREKDERIIGNIVFEIQVDKLGFNTKKGSYINGQLVSANPQFVLNKNRDKLNLPAFGLTIGEQEFNATANFDFAGINAYQINFENSDTNFQETRRLLPDSLSAKLARFELKNPLETSFRLKGKFEYGDIPFIDVKFQTRNNRLKYGKSASLTDVDFTGHITNSFSSEVAPGKKKPDRQDIRAFFKEFTASLEDIRITGTDSYFQSSKEAKNYVKANLKIAGSNESLAKALQADRFNFNGGDFNLNAHISGDIQNPALIFDHANGNFRLKDTRVILKKNNLQLPVNELKVNLNKNGSKLERLRIDLPNGQELDFSGSVKNISSLLISDPDKPASTDVLLNSKELDLNQLLATTTEYLNSNSANSNRYNTLNEAFEAIYSKFQPRFRLNLNKLSFKGNQFQNVKADLLFQNAETLRLEKMGFQYNEASTSINGTVRIPESNKIGSEPVYINVAANSNGPIKVFDQLFNIKILDINAGHYNFKGKLTGDLRKFEQLLEKANGDLLLTNTRFYYPRAAVDIELDSLKIAVYESNIDIKPFKIEIEDHRPFSLEARVEQFPGFLLDSLQSNGQIQINMDAPYVDLDRWMKTLGSIHKDSIKPTQKKPDLHAVFEDIHRYHPEFKLSVDSLKYSGLFSRDLEAQLLFENDSILKLDELRMTFENSEGVIRGQVEAKSKSYPETVQSPFKFIFSVFAEGRSQDLNELLKTVNFNLESGDFRFRASYEGEASDLEILNSSARGNLNLMNTRVGIDGTGIKLPVDSLHLMIENDNAFLKNLDMRLPGKSSVNITGQIDNFSSFINNEDLTDSHTSSFKIKAAYLSKKDIQQLLIGGADNESEGTANAGFRLASLKEVLSNIKRSYRPSATLEIDSLVYDKLAVSGFSSHIDYSNSGTIRIANTLLHYDPGKVSLDLEAGIETPAGLPVTIRMNIEDLFLEKLLKDLNHFNNKELKAAEKLSGMLNLELDLTGILTDSASIDINSLNGKLKMKLRDLNIYGLDPITENVVLLKEERFEKLRFRPIIQSFEIKNGIVEIPRTQVQSTALQFFIEGESKMGEYHNIWISLPWHNIFKSRDDESLPEKTTFKDSGAKFYIQFIQDRNSEKERKRKLRTKFRLSNRKLQKIKQ